MLKSATVPVLKLASTHSNKAKKKSSHLMQLSFDFIPFVRYCCCNFGNEFDVDIIKLKQPYPSRVNRLVPDGSSTTLTMTGPDTVYIQAIYPEDKLSEIALFNNRRIPRILFKIINMSLCYEKNLNTIRINQGLTNAAIYELETLLHFSNVSDLILDDTYIIEANYYVLLERSSRLRHLSLARCGIEDVGTQLIASKLIFPQPASTTLVVLNLSSNMITDHGAKCLATALKTNRKLGYLNLSDNQISDKGAKEILNVLRPFKLEYSELIARKERFLRFIKNNYGSFVKIGKRGKEKEKAKLRTKQHARNSISKKKVPQGRSYRQSRNSRSSYHESMFLVPEINETLVIIRKLLSEFIDPYQNDQLTIDNGSVSCIGNYSLSCLSLSYNALSFSILTTIEDVLDQQRVYLRTPYRGLIKLSIEGNPLPMESAKYKKISYGLECIQNRLANRQNVKNN